MFSILSKFGTALNFPKSTPTQPCLSFCTQFLQVKPSMSTAHYTAEVVFTKILKPILCIKSKNYS